MRTYKVWEVRHAIFEHEYRRVHKMLLEMDLKYFPAELGWLFK